MSWKSHYEQQAQCWRVLAQRRASGGNVSSAQIARDIASLYENLAKQSKA